MDKSQYRKFGEMTVEQRATFVAMIASSLELLMPPDAMFYLAVMSSEEGRTVGSMRSTIHPDDIPAFLRELVEHHERTPPNSSVPANGHPAVSVPGATDPSDPSASDMGRQSP